MTIKFTYDIIRTMEERYILEVDSNFRACENGSTRFLSYIKYDSNPTIRGYFTKFKIDALVILSLFYCPSGIYDIIKSVIPEVQCTFENGVNYGYTESVGTYPAIIGPSGFKTWKVNRKISKIECGKINISMSCKRKWPLPDNLDNWRPSIESHQKFKF